MAMSGTGSATSPASSPTLRREQRPPITQDHETPSIVRWGWKGIGGHELGDFEYQAKRCLETNNAAGCIEAIQNLSQAILKIETDRESLETEKTKPIRTLAQNVLLAIGDSSAAQEAFKAFLTQEETTENERAFLFSSRTATILRLTESACKLTGNKEGCVALIDQLYALALESLRGRDIRVNERLEQIEIEKSESPYASKVADGEVKVKARQMKKALALLRQTHFQAELYLALPAEADKFPKLFFDGSLSLEEKNSKLQALRTSWMENLAQLEKQEGEAAANVEMAIGAYQVQLEAFNQRVIPSFVTKNYSIPLTDLIALRCNLQALIAEVTAETDASKAPSFQERLQKLQPEFPRIILIASKLAELDMESLYTYGDALHKPPAAGRQKERFEDLRFDKLQEEFKKQTQPLKEEISKQSSEVINLLKQAGDLIAKTDGDLQVQSFAATLNQKIAELKAKYESLTKEVDATIATGTETLEASTLSALKTKLRGATNSGSFHNQFDTLASKKQEIIKELAHPLSSKTPEIKATWALLDAQGSELGNKLDRIQDAIDALGFKPAWITTLTAKVAYNATVTVVTATMGPKYCTRYEGRIWPNGPDKTAQSPTKVEKQ